MPTEHTASGTVISGSARINLDPVTAGEPTRVQSYFGVAQAMLDGARILAAQRKAAIAHAALCGQALECALKAFLCGPLGEKRAAGFGHNIADAWDAAASAGLPIAVPMPDWATRLAKLHDRPYVLRYMEGVHAVGGPPMDVMTQGVENLLELVRQSIA